jgi:hypothetical protein
MEEVVGMDVAQKSTLPRIGARGQNYCFAPYQENQYWMERGFSLRGIDKSVIRGVNNRA